MPWPSLAPTLSISSISYFSSRIWLNLTFTYIMELLSCVCSWVVSKEIKKISGEREGIVQRQWLVIVDDGPMSTLAQFFFTNLLVFYECSWSNQYTLLSDAFLILTISCHLKIPLKSYCSQSTPITHTAALRNQWCSAIMQWDI